MSWKFVSRKFLRWALRFHWKIWGFTLKKLKLGRDPPNRTPKPHKWNLLFTRTSVPIIISNISQWVVYLLIIIACAWTVDLIMNQIKSLCLSLVTSHLFLFKSMKLFLQIRVLCCLFLLFSCIFWCLRNLQCMNKFASCRCL